jgi:hypothetical protein
LEECQLLIVHADDNVVLGVAGRGTGSKSDRGANGQSMPFDDFEFAHVDLNRA